MLSLGNTLLDQKVQIGWKQRIYHANSNHKKARVVILITDKIDGKIKMLLVIKGEIL